MPSSSSTRLRTDAEVVGRLHKAQMRLQVIEEINKGWLTDLGLAERKAASEFTLLLLGKATQKAAWFVFPFKYWHTCVLS